MTKKIRIIGAALVGALWIALSCAAWLLPAKEFSDAERRKLAQFPELSTETVLDGSFMTDFEDYTLDQFPLRDSFRKMKALFHYHALGQKDNNGIFLHDGYAAKLEYPLNKPSVDNALNRFQYLYDTYLKDTGSKVVMAVVPDKSYYLQDQGYLTMDYAQLFATVEAGMPYAQTVDLTDALSLEDYYYTDTHWRQEKLLGAAGKLSAALDITPPRQEDFAVTQVPKGFYGVYYGQAALPMDAEPMYILKSPLLEGCTVINHENGKASKVYDMSKLNGKELYDVYLSGPVSLLEIQNPAAKTDRELIVFRDSFGSSMVPLLVQDYKTVTLVDIRYISGTILNRFIDFHGQDVLFLYSTLVLNNSGTFK